MTSRPGYLRRQCPSGAVGASSDLAHFVYRWLGGWVPVTIDCVTERPVSTRDEWMRVYRRVLETRSADVAEDRLRALAGDQVLTVRIWTARSRRTPADALALLAEDPDHTVRHNALLNPNTPDSALRSLAGREARQSGSWSFSHRAVIVHHPNVSEGLRAELVAAGACSCPKRCGQWAFLPRERGGPSTTSTAAKYSNRADRIWPDVGVGSTLRRPSDREVS